MAEFDTIIKERRHPCGWDLAPPLQGRHRSQRRQNRQNWPPQEQRGPQVLDAAGLVVAPGVIDLG
jgi:hypothetical protein